VRSATVQRETGETRIDLTLELDGTGTLSGETGIGFFDHMLHALVKHARFDLSFTCAGDLHVDDHHSIEDLGICIGQAFHQALGDGRGITRFSHSYVPLDEALCRTVVDISGRGFLAFDSNYARSTIGAFSTEMVREFFKGFVDHAAITLHVNLLAGINAHHQVEATFKSVAKALRNAVAIDAGISDIPSTKGSL
jgi:imidazoleglycerol-phosphate dehydratase